MGRPPIKTKNGYDLGEVVSALQKCIRRGDEDNALFFAAEMHKSGYHRYVWKRLLVIVSEDIGIAARGLVNEVFTLCQMSEWFRKNNKEDDHDALFISHAIILMCRAPKCRMNDHAACLYFYSKTPLPAREIPDAALDMHTRRGRNMKRGLDHFWQEASQLVNEADIHDPYWEKYQESWLAQDNCVETTENSNGNGQLFDTDFMTNW